MYEFGEGLIIESYKVPWLIWIQLLVMILIVLLLFFGFSVFTLDLSDNSSPNSSAAGPSSSAVGGGGGGGGQTHGKAPLPITSSSRRTNQGQDQKHITEGGVETSTSRGIRIGEERDGSSVKDATHFGLFERPQHPCHFLGLAKQAFLKCLGLDSAPDNSDRRKHEKED